MKSRSHKQVEPSIINILNERYARGEVTREEFLQTRKDLRENAGQAASPNVKAEPKPKVESEPKPQPVYPKILLEEQERKKKLTEEKRKEELDKNEELRKKEDLRKKEEAKRKLKLEAEKKGFSEQLLAAVYFRIRIKRGTEASTTLAGLVRALYFDSGSFQFDQLERLDQSSRHLAEALIQAKKTGTIPQERWEKAYGLTREFETLKSERSPENSPRVLTSAMRQQGALSTEAASGTKPALREWMNKIDARLELATRKAGRQLTTWVPNGAVSGPAAKNKLFGSGVATFAAAVALLVFIAVVQEPVGLLKAQQQVKHEAGPYFTGKLSPGSEAQIAELTPKQKARTDKQEIKTDHLSETARVAAPVLMFSAPTEVLPVKEERPVPPPALERR